MVKKTLVALALFMPLQAMSEASVGVLDPIAALQSSNNVKT